MQAVAPAQGEQQPLPPGGALSTVADQGQAVDREAFEGCDRSARVSGLSLLCHLTSVFIPPTHSFTLHTSSSLFNEAETERRKT